MLADEEQAERGGGEYLDKPCRAPGTFRLYAWNSRATLEIGNGLDENVLSRERPLDRRARQKAADVVRSEPDGLGLNNPQDEADWSGIPE